MRQFKPFFAASAVLFLLFSCKSEEASLSLPDNEFVFSVSAELFSIEQESRTKGYLGSFISASWNEGDRISVVNLTSGKILGGSLVADRSGIKSTFSGTVSGSINVGDAVALFYPSFGNDAEVEFGSRSVDLAEQYKADKVPLVTYSTFTAEKADGTFSGLELGFKYVLSYLKINMADLPSSATVSKITLRCVPNHLSVSVNATGDGFDVATATEQSAREKIELLGKHETTENGMLAIAVGVMPSDACSNRTVVVTADGYGDYLAPMTADPLESHKYYNTIVNKFELVGLEGEQNYGIYDLGNRTVIDRYEEFSDNVIIGLDKGGSDFTLLNAFSSKFWIVKGIPADAAEGTSFPAKVFTNNVGLPFSLNLENAVIRMVEPDEEYTKLWIKAGNTLFIVRK